MPACFECGLRHYVMRSRRRSHQHGIALDALQRLFKDCVARGGFCITAGFGVWVDDGGELDTGAPATSPDQLRPQIPNPA
jgi:hypothetical protein